MRKKLIFIPIFFIGMMALVIWILMLLWNWLLPDIFELRQITFWEAGGLLLMAKILFGGFHMGGKGSHNSSHSRTGWKKKFKEKWASMPEEDKAKWRSKFGGMPCSDKESSINKDEQE